MNTKKALPLLLLVFIFFASCIKNSENGKAAIPANNATIPENPISNAKSNEDKAITENDFKLVHASSGLAFGLFDSIDPILEKLGEKNYSVIRNNSADPFYDVLSADWESIIIEWVKGNKAILRIIATSSDYSTIRGVKIGDNIDKIFSLYGSNQRHESQERIEYDLGNKKEETMMALLFYYKDSVITKIELLEGN